MEKRKKANSIRKLLTLMLAFVMVFTGMGIGSWGVDAAWAEGKTYVVSFNMDKATSNDMALPIYNGKISFTEKDDKKWFTDQSTTTTYVATIENEDDITLQAITLIGINCTTALRTNVKKMTFKKQGYKLSDLTAYQVSAKELAAQGVAFDSENAKTAGLSDNCRDYYFIGVYNSKTKLHYAIIIQKKKGNNVADKTALQATIDKVTGENAGNYYQAEDRYNGKKTSTSGFWAEMDPILRKAQAVALDDDVAEKEVDAVKEELETAIANLIPTSQINPTVLYEVVHAPLHVSSAGGYVYTNKTLEDCTEVTAAAYPPALDAAQVYLDGLFDTAGEPTAANDSENTEAVNTYNARVQALADAMAGLALQSEYDNCRTFYYNNREDALALLEQYAPKKLQEEDYTPESWATYLSAYETLKADMSFHDEGGTRADVEFLYNFRYAKESGQIGHYAIFQAACRGLVSAKAVTVDFTYTDNAAAKTGPARAYHNAKLTLESGKTTVASVLEEVVQAQLGSNAQYLINLNGSYYGSDAANIQIHDGDVVKVAQVTKPKYQRESSTGLDSVMISTYDADDEALYRDSIADIHMSAPQTAAVGETVTFEASVTATAGSKKGQALPAENLLLYISAENNADICTRTYAATDQNGKATYVFREPGEYRVAMYNITDDVLSFTDVYNDTTYGSYYSLYAGDTMLITVGEATEDSQTLLTKYRTANLAEAKAYLDGFHDYDFTEANYQKIQTQYQLLVDNQNKAEDFKTLMQSFDIDFANLKKLTVDKIDHAAVIAALRSDLECIPEDLAELNYTHETIVQRIAGAYAALSEYQQTLLSPAEVQKITALADYVSAHPEYTKTRDIKVTMEQNITVSTSPGWTTSAPNQVSIYEVQADGTRVVKKNVWGTNGNAPTVSYDNAHPGYQIEVCRLCDITDEHYWMVWSVDNGTTWQLPQQMEAKSTTTNHLNDRMFTVCYTIPQDAADTVHLQLKMISKEAYENMLNAETDEELQAAKTAAVQSLKAAYDGYRNTGLLSIYEEWEAKILAAKTSAEVTKARTAGLAALAAAAAAGSSDPNAPTDYPSGNPVGKVSIHIENTTYAGGDFYGDIVNGTFVLCENDTMMSCILKALKQSGYSWNGTAGSSKDPLTDYSITYIGSIEKADQTTGKTLSLGEFDGNSKSGWMGTLNDWFVNQSFAFLTVKNGQLADGDEIHVMFTMNLGEDIGGTWNNTNTKLAGLTISGGTLSPAFSGSQTDYTLIISGDKANVTVTPEAANKNYQARIFLNSYNKDSARYKRTETISVKSGDILYVGVGESGWPTMNSGGVGTKYTIKVVSGSDASAVKNMLTALKDITYNNYRAEKGNVEAAGAAYNALTAEAKKNVSAEELKKLTDAEAQIKFYSEIDDAKAKLNALTSSSSSSQAREALAAYEKLSKEQKEYITKADAERFNELAKKYNLNPISGVEEMPESEVATTGKVGSASTSSPTEVKVTGTTAVVTVKAENQKEILKQAKENQSAEVVLVVADTDAKGTDKVELNLDKAFLQSLLKDTKAKLVVKTPFGQKTYDREAMQALADSAAGSTIKTEINADNVDAINDEAAKLEKAKELTASLALTARSTKTAKKNVKVSLKMTKASAASIAELQDMGYTVKYKFYRSTKKASKYAAKITKTSKNFTNTKGVKGKKYYYKARVMVYDQDGKLVTYSKLTQCKYAARTWTK